MATANTRRLRIERLQDRRLMTANHELLADSPLINDECGPANQLTGDFNSDGAVELEDFLVLADHFGQDVDGYLQGDLDCDGKVGFADFAMLSHNYGRALPQNTGPRFLSHPQQIVLTEDQLFQFTVTTEDADGDKLFLSHSAKGTLDESDFEISSQGNTHTVQVTPPADVHGEFEFWITVDDLRERDHVHERTVHISGIIEEVNDPPSFGSTIPDYVEFHQGQSHTISLVVVDKEQSQLEITANVDGVLGNSEVRVEEKGPTHEVIFQPEEGKYGNSTVRLVVSDGETIVSKDITVKILSTPLQVHDASFVSNASNTEPGKWSSRFITYCFMGDGVADTSGLDGGWRNQHVNSFMPSGATNAIRSAFSAWEEVADISFMEVPDGGEAFGQESPTGCDIRIGGHPIPNHIEESGEVIDLLAHARHPGDNADGISGDIQFDSTNDWFVDSHNEDTDTPDIFHVAAHEIGIALGLTPTENALALMHPVYREWPSKQGLTAHDTAAIQQLYGPSKRMESRSYEFALTSADARVVTSDSDLNTDDWTNLGIGYDFHASPDRQTVTAHIWMEAWELEGDGSYRGKTVIRTEREFVVYQVPDGEPRRIHDVIGGTSVSWLDPWHLGGAVRYQQIPGKVHGMRTSEDVASLRNLRYRIDAHGGNDLHFQWLSGTLEFAVVLQ